jgi:UDP-glucuronate 4-epimerase
MEKRILITGAAGFIGFHVAQASHLAGYGVTAIDTFSPLYPVSYKEARADALKKLGVEVQRIDICDQAALINLIEKNQISHIVHLAAHASVRKSLENPEDYIKTNVTGLLHILEACKAFPQIKLVYASTSTVYGANTKVPFSLTDPTDNPIEVYGVTKKCDELLAHCYHSLYNIPCVGLRFFTVYGPWGRPDMAYFSFTKSILENSPIKLYGNGAYRRDYIYIDDVVAAIMASLDYQKPLAIFNIGSSTSTSGLELVTTLEKALGKPAKKILHPDVQTEMFETLADISETTKLLGTHPKTSFEEGIDHFVTWYRKQYD